MSLDIDDCAAIGGEQAIGELAALRARATALELDRDQLSLTLAAAKADRDKWFNRAKTLEAALRKIRKGYSPYTLFEEIDAVLTALETKAEQICTCDGIDQDPCPKHSEAKIGAER
jgi:hypothetical protein